jgi:hypothetical protein
VILDDDDDNLDKAGARGEVEGAFGDVDTRRVKGDASLQHLRNLRTRLRADRVY